MRYSIFRIEYDLHVIVTSEYIQNWNEYDNNNNQDIQATIKKNEKEEKKKKKKKVTINERKTITRSSFCGPMRHIRIVICTLRMIIISFQIHRNIGIHQL